VACFISDLRAYAAQKHYGITTVNGAGDHSFATAGLTEQQDCGILRCDLVDAK
jgi:hypothetical protein